MGSRARGLSSSGSWAQLLHGRWDLPRPGVEPTSLVLAGRFLTTGPLGRGTWGIIAQCGQSFSFTRGKSSGGGWW